jgi:glutathione S-transferase
MGRPILYGADYSVYVRIARLTLIEKGVDHALVPVDVFAAEGPPAWYAHKHPFGRIPAFEHDGIVLYETNAICRYVDEAFEGPPLQPSTPVGRALANQIVGLLDSYAYRPMVWDISVETVAKPAEGGTTDPAVVEAALPRAQTCLAELARLQGPRPWLAGDTLTLADLHAAAILGYFLKAPLAAPMLARHPGLHAWWERVSARPSWRETEASG